MTSPGFFAPHDRGCRPVYAGDIRAAHMGLMIGHMANAELERTIRRHAGIDSFTSEAIEIACRIEAGWRGLPPVL